jgi:hypothetical protein
LRVFGVRRQHFIQNLGHCHASCSNTKLCLRKIGLGGPVFTDIPRIPGGCEVTIIPSGILGKVESPSVAMKAAETTN